VAVLIGSSKKCLAAKSTHFISLLKTIEGAATDSKKGLRSILVGFLDLLPTDPSGLRTSPARYNGRMDEKRGGFQFTLRALLKAMLFAGLSFSILLANPYLDASPESPLFPLSLLAFVFGGMTVGTFFGKTAAGALLGFVVSLVYVGVRAFPSNLLL
jgi:hypothetical protein